MKNNKILILPALLLFTLLFTSCAVKTLPVQEQPTFVYKSGEYALHKLEKERSFARLARIYLGDENRAWKIEDANNPSTLESSSFIVIPLKEKNRGGIFEDGYQTVPILCYHKLGFGKNSPLITPPDVFEQQMKYLKDNGYRVISPADLLGFLEYRTQIPKKSVLITFDDGYKSVYDIAWPILKEYGFTATAFVYTDYVGISKKALSWENLRQLKAHGFTIGSHTLSHADLTKKDPGENDTDFHRRIKKELLMSKKIIDKQLNQDTISLAFPYGRYSPKAMETAKSVGYKIAVTVDRGSNPFFTNPLALNRDMILKKSMEKFISRLKTFNNVSLR